MRRPETIRLTLNAAETGHLVIATLHSANVVEALQRIVASFAPDAQPQVCSQLADCLVGIVSQQLIWHRAAKQRVPECEILSVNTAVRNAIRQNQLHRLGSIMQLGHKDGMWTRLMYQSWLSTKSRFASPPQPGTKNVVAEERRASPIRKRISKPNRASVRDGVFELEEDADPASIIAEFSRKKT